MESLLSVEQAAERLGISLWTVYRLAREGRLPSLCVGRRRLFDPGDLQRFVEQARGQSITSGKRTVSEASL